VAGVAYNQRALIVGKTQSGKTTFARHLFAGFTGARRLLVNVKREVDIGVPAVGDVAAIDWLAPVVDFIPRTLERDVFEQLYERIRAAPAPRVVWLDEAAGPTGKGYAPVYLRVVQQQGGGLGIGHIVCTQRPVNIASELVTEAEHIFIFGLPGRLDLKYLADEMRLPADYLAGRLEQVRARHPSGDEKGSYAFVWWERATGELVDCAPLDAAWVTAPVAPTVLTGGASSALA
jgi:hypothetical protein